MAVEQQPAKMWSGRFREPRLIVQRWLGMTGTFVFLIAFLGTMSMGGMFGSLTHTPAFICLGLLLLSSILWLNANRKLKLICRGKESV